MDGGGGGWVKRKRIWQSQELWEAECAESISAITFLSDYSPRRGRKKKAFEEERGRKEEGGKDLCVIVRLRAATLCQITRHPTTQLFSHSQLQISPLGCRLSVPLPCAQRGCVCVCVCVSIRVGRWEWTFSGWEMAVLSHITRHTSKPTVVSWCDVDSNCLGWDGGAAGWSSSGSYGI